MVDRRQHHRRKRTSLGSPAQWLGWCSLVVSVAHGTFAFAAEMFNGVWRITRVCDGASQHFDRCRNNDAYLVTTQLTLSRVDDTVCGEIDQILSPLRSAGGFVWGKVYGDVAHVYFSNSSWGEPGDPPGEATLRLRDNKLDWRVTREAAGKWSVDSALGLAPLPRKRYSVEIWCPSQLGKEVNNGQLEQGVQVTWKRYPKIPKRPKRSTK